MSVQTFFPLVVDSTMMMEWDDCEMAFFRKYLQHLSKGNESVDLVAGKAFARGMEVTRKAYFNGGAEQEEAIQAGRDALYEEYGDFVPKFPTTKTLEKMATALELYFINYPLGADIIQPAKLENGEYAIEYSFAHELPIAHPDIPGMNIIFTGRADMIGVYADRLWCVDEKTTGAAFTQEWSKQWDTRGQFSTYPWGLRKDGIKVAGAYIRGIYLGKANIKFAECQTVRGEWQLEVWEKQMLTKLQALITKYNTFKESGLHPAEFFFGNWSSSCMKYFKPCQFQDLCRDKHSEKFLESNYSQYIWLPHEQRRERLDIFLEEIGHG